jgi:hypothetical protein
MVYSHASILMQAEKSFVMFEAFDGLTLLASWLADRSIVEQIGKWCANQILSL